MLVFFISDEKLLSFHLKRSDTLPDLMDYRTIGDSGIIGNPIMNCLADQTKYDLEWKHCHFTPESFLKAILMNLENGHLVWPGSIGINNWPGSIGINKNEWIKKTKENPTWYLFNKDGLQDQGLTFVGESLLLLLASNYLKRKIQLIPIFKKGFKMVGAEFSSSKPYRLMSFQDMSYQVLDNNFFLSVL